MPWPRAIAIALAPLTVAMVCAAITVQLVAGAAPDSAEVALTSLIALTTTGLALVVVWREPANGLAGVLALMALLAATVGFSDTYRPAHLRDPQQLPDLPTAAGALLSVMWVWVFTALTLLLLLFPTGRPLSRAWGWVAIAIPVVAVAIHAVMVTTPAAYDAPYADLQHPFGTLPLPVATGLKVVLFPALMLLLLAAAISLVARYRRGDERLRKQAKWLVLALPLVPVTFVLGWGGYLLLGTYFLAGIGLALLYLAVPIATTIAILRHDLFDVDRAVAGAALYSVLTVGVVGAYAGAAALSGALLGNQSSWAAAAVTAGLALVLAPARRRVQRTVDRVLYPARRSACDAVAVLENRVNGGTGAPEELEPTLRAALHAPGLRVGVVAPGETGYVDVDGQPVDVGEGVVVTVDGEPIGVLVAEGISRALLADVAVRATILVEMIRLRQEATRALEDARESRARLQQVGYEERRRLERDLHDVAQQRLVALGLSMRLAQRRLKKTGDAELATMIAQWVDEVSRSSAELRDLAHGIRPSCLDDGLPSALSMLARDVPLPLDADIVVHRQLPDQVSTTAYYVVAEALTNALKHGHPSGLWVQVRDEGDRLLVRVRDDGCGGAVVGQVGGLSAVRDRVSASGGVLYVDSRPGQGTSLEAVLPCAS
ncbi:sensor histidine kinase [Kribbella swartbergensis]